MAEETRGGNLPTEALVVGYAMSRLDASYLLGRGMSSWKEAFSEAADALHVRATSLNNLRDEYDPIFGHRKGWHQRPMRPDRLRVMGDLAELTDEALMAMVDSILAGDREAVEEAITSLAEITRPAYNVVERRLTGRRAEEYFLEHCERIVEIVRPDIIDLRHSAGGFDFGVRLRDELAIEVKGLKQNRGAIQFTDREWTVAGERKEHYWLVVVGNLASEPVSRLIRDPHSHLDASCRFQKSVSATWHSIVSLEV